MCHKCLSCQINCPKCGDKCSHKPISDPSIRSFFNEDFSNLNRILGIQAFQNIRFKEIVNYQNKKIAYMEKIINDKNKMVQEQHVTIGNLQQKLKQAHSYPHPPVKKINFGDHNIGDNISSGTGKAILSSKIGQTTTPQPFQSTPITGHEYHKISKFAFCNRPPSSIVDPSKKVAIRKVY